MFIHNAVWRAEKNYVYYRMYTSIGKPTVWYLLSASGGATVEQRLKLSGLFENSDSDLL